MKNFYDFVNSFRMDEVLSLSDAGKVRRQIRKSAGYRPGTFGIELEFPAEWAEGVVEDDINNSDIPADVKYDHSVNMRKLNAVIDRNEETVGGDNGDETSWGIGPDFANTELRSRYLTTNDIPLLRSIMNDIKRVGLKGSPNCSAHVHIGLQQFDDMNAFDALAVIDLIDEEKIYDIAGDDRETMWTQPKKELVGALYGMLVDKYGTFSGPSKSVVMSDDKLRDMFESEKLLKYMGTNLKAYITHGTIEFRYLSSEVLGNINQFLSMIQYYLMIPFLARRKMSIKLVGGYYSPVRTLYFTRSAGNRITVSNRSAAHPYGGVADTRGELPPTLKDRFKEVIDSRVVNYFKDRTVGEFVDKLLALVEKYNVPLKADSAELIKGARVAGVNSMIFVLGYKIRAKIRSFSSIRDKKLSNVSVLDRDTVIEKPFADRLTCFGKILDQEYTISFESLYKTFLGMKVFG